MTTNFFLFHLCLLFLLSCAAQAPASGGPTDKDGPILISIHPKNESVNIRSDQKITLTFNEPINPVSIPSSISLSANYKLNIKSRKIIILPNKIWPKNQIINIKISRKVRDYQNQIAELEKQIEDINKPELTPMQLDNIHDAIENVVNDFNFEDNSNYNIEYELDYDGRVTLESLEFQNHYELASMIVEKVSELFKEIEEDETDK